MGRKNRKGVKSRGHYCWSCESYRGNEKFSGAGRARHVCKDCTKLGESELKYRQTVRNMERCFTFEGVLRKKQKANFEQYLNSSDPKIQETARQMLANSEEIVQGLQESSLDIETYVVGTHMAIAPDFDSCHDEDLPF